MPQFNYTTQQPIGTVGQIAEGFPVNVDTYSNELLPQISTVTFAGVVSATADAAFTISVTGPDGEVVSTTFTAIGGEDSTAIATAWVAAAEASDDWANVAALTDQGTGVIQFAFIHPGRAYSFTVTVDEGTGVSADQQASGGENIPLGIAVAFGSSDNLAALVEGGTTDADLAGVTVRSVDALSNDLNNSVNLYYPGDTMAVLSQGRCWVYVEDAVTKGGQAFCRTANALPGRTLGTFRSDATDSIQMNGATYGSSTSGPGLAILRVNRPA